MNFELASDSYREKSQEFNGKTKMENSENSQSYGCFCEGTFLLEVRDCLHVERFTQVTGY